MLYRGKVILELITDKGNQLVYQKFQLNINIFSKANVINGGGRSPSPLTYITIAM